MARHGTKFGSGDPAKAGGYAIAALAIALSAFWVAKAVVIFVAPQSEWVAPLPVTTPANAPQARVPLDVNFDPFNRDGEEAVVDLVVGQDAPETTLNLRLIGQRAAGQDSSATIETPDRRQALYSIDDEILPGVTLDSVQSDFVVIRRATGLERLSMRRDTLFGQDIQATPTAASAPRIPPQDAPRRVERRTSAPSSLSGAAKNPLGQVVAGDLIENISLTPVREGAGLLGYRVASRGADISTFGFADGDILTSVNGRDLTSGRLDRRSLFQELRESSSAVFVVLRDGAPITVRVGQ